MEKGGRVVCSARASLSMRSTSSRILRARSAPLSASVCDANAANAANAAAAQVPSMVWRCALCGWQRPHGPVRTFVL